MNKDGVLVVNGTQVFDPIKLEIGWNLVGCNSQAEKPVEEAMSSIVGEYNSIWTYDPDESKWFRYIPDGPEDENNLKFIQPGHGYWIDARELCWWYIGP